MKVDITHTLSEEATRTVEFEPDEAPVIEVTPRRGADPYLVRVDRITQRVEIRDGTPRKAGVSASGRRFNVDGQVGKRQWSHPGWVRTLPALEQWTVPVEDLLATARTKQ